MLFSYTYLQFKKLFLFFILLVALLVFNLYYNMFFSWPGVALIVRMYVFVFSFFLVYNYTMEEDLYYQKYSERHGKFGSVFFIFENRILLFFIILIFSSLYRITEYSGFDDWPMKYFLSIFDGKSSNLIFFALAFFIALKLMRHPILTVTLFLSLSVTYNFLNTAFYNYNEYGSIVSVYKIIKMIILFMIINVSYCKKIRHYFHLVISSVLLSAVVWGVSFGVYYFGYKNFNPHAADYSYVSDKLIKFGYYEPINSFVEMEKTKKSGENLLRLNKYARFYDINLNFTDQEWSEIFIKSSSSKNIDEISKIIVSKNIVLSYDVIYKSISAAKIQDRNIKKLHNYITLVSKTINETNASDFLSLYVNSNPEMIKFGIIVSGKSKTLYFIPQLLTYLISVNDSISQAAYESLSEITGRDAAGELELPINSPEVYAIFKDFYQKKYIPLKQGN